MKERMLILTASLMLLLGAVSAFAQPVNCELRTGNNGHILFAANTAPPDASVVRVYDDTGDCVGEAVAGADAFALTVHGFDALSNQHFGFGGARQGSTLRVTAQDDDLEYNLALAFSAAEPFYHTSQTYQTDMISVVESVEPVVVTADAGFVTQEVETTGEWQVVFNITSPVPTGAILLEFRTSGSALVTGITPAADTYISGDTLAASYIGAGGTNVNFTISGQGTGLLLLHRLRGTDREQNLFDFTIGIPAVRISQPAFVVDLDGDGSLTDDDVRALFIALVRDEEGAYPQADIFPFPTGDGVVNLLDFYYLNVANVTRRWPDGRDVQ